MIANVAEMLKKEELAYSQNLNLPAGQNRVSSVAGGHNLPEEKKHFLVAKEII